MIEEWHDHKATCPKCGETWEDLWDYEWRHHESIDIECPHCEAPLTLLRNIDVTYAAVEREE